MANTLADHNKIVEVSKNFRDYLIPLNHPRLHPSDRDARTHGKDVLGNEEIFLTPVAKGWLKNYQQPYHGFTTDGTVRPNLWRTDPNANGPTKAMVEAATSLMNVATEEEKQGFSYAVNAKEWRSWSNPEVSSPYHRHRPSLVAKLISGHCSRLRRPPRRHAKTHTRRRSRSPQSHPLSFWLYQSLDSNAHQCFPGRINDTQKRHERRQLPLLPFRQARG
jgi:hypothetical protein